MPDQPDDPLHYEMKIPPEPEPEKHDSDEPSAADDAQQSGKVKETDETNAVRRDEKSQSKRRP